MWLLGGAHQVGAWGIYARTWWGQGARHGGGGGEWARWLRGHVGAESAGAGRRVERVQRAWRLLYLQAIMHEGRAGYVTPHHALAP